MSIRILDPTMSSQREEAQTEEKEKDQTEEGKEEQEVWSWGAGGDGQLATGTLHDELAPQYVASLSSLPISFIACGAAHALALLRGGEVVSWGRGKAGQLGHGDCKSVLQPMLVKPLENIVIRRLAAGWSHSAFVSERGELFTCGDGTFGQLGHGDFESRYLPCRVSAFAAKHVSMVSCGMRHTLVLLEGISVSSVFSFGSARHGQLGVAASGQIINVLNSTRRETKCFNIPLCITDLDTQSVAFVCANGDHSAALTESGHLYVWGKGFDGTLDIHAPMLVTKELSFCQVALGWNNGLVLTDDGEAYMWGGTHHGKLGVKKENTLKVVSNGSDQAGDSLALQRITLIEGKKIKHIASGAEHFAIILENDVLKMWGWGEHGQLGLGSTCDQQCPQTVPIPAEERKKYAVYCGSGFTFALRCIP